MWFDEWPPAAPGPTHPIHNKNSTYSFWLENANARRSAANDGDGDGNSAARHRLRTPTQQTTKIGFIFLSTFNATRRACMMIRFVCASRRFDYHNRSQQHGRRSHSCNSTTTTRYLFCLHFQAIFRQPKKWRCDAGWYKNCKTEFCADSLLAHIARGSLVVSTMHTQQWALRAHTWAQRDRGRQTRCTGTRYAVPLLEEQQEDKEKRNKKRTTKRNESSEQRSAHTDRSCGTLKFISLVNIHVTFYVPYTHCIAHRYVQAAVSGV